MAASFQKTSPTTQHFTGIEDIIDDVVILPGKQACQIIEVTATNFSLQSTQEQQIKILSYASLLNSLSFPIQIVILSRKLDISSYLTLLDNHAKNTSNPKLSEHITNYRSFIADLVKNNDVLDKKFYISVSYSFLEKGAGAVGTAKDKNAFVYDAKNILGSKSLAVMQEVSRIGIKARVLRKNELIKLFYEVFNQDRLDEKIFENFHETHVQGGGK